MNPVREILTRIVATLLLLPVFLVVAELAVWGLKGSGESRKDVVQTPYMPTRMRPDFRGSVANLYFETNQFGFRSQPDLTLEPGPSEFRMMLLGDSVGFGFGVEAEGQFTRVAERVMNDSSNPTEIFRLVNASGQGYSPSSYYSYLLHEGLRFKPKVVLLQIELCNDISDEALLRWSFEPGHEPSPERVRGGRYVVAWDGNLLGTVALGPYFYETSYSYTFLLRRVLDSLFLWFPRGPLATEPGATYFNLGFDRFLLTEDRLEKGWSRLVGALRATRELLQQQSVELFLLILPSRYMFDGQAPSHQAFAKGLYQRALGEARAIGLESLEFEEELQRNGGAALYLDFAHPNREGNRIIGEKLGRVLLSELRESAR